MRQAIVLCAHWCHSGVNISATGSVRRLSVGVSLAFAFLRYRVVIRRSCGSVEIICALPWERANFIMSEHFT